MSSNYVPPPKSQYEIERDERIARNEAFMRSPASAAASAPSCPNSDGRPRRRGPSARATGAREGERKSSRLAGRRCAARRSPRRRGARAALRPCRAARASPRTSTSLNNVAARRGR